MGLERNNIQKYCFKNKTNPHFVLIVIMILKNTKNWPIISSILKLLFLIIMEIDKVNRVELIKKKSN